MAETLKQLRGVSDDELIERMDQIGTHLSPGYNHYRDELFRREQERQNTVILDYTRKTAALTFWITLLTIVMAVATLINLIILFVQP